MSLDRAIDRFRRVGVTVVGDAMLDVYLEGVSRRLCPDGPVPVVDLHARTEIAGGAANTASNVAALGADVTLVSVVGDDREARRLRELLEERGVRCRFVESAGRRTLVKTRVSAGGQTLVRYDEGSTDPPAAATAGQLRRLVAGPEVLIVSDYGYGVVTREVMDGVRAELLAVDSKTLADFRQIGPTVVKPNYRQAVDLLGERPLDGTEARAAQMAQSSARVLDLVGARVAAITLDDAGAVVAERDRPVHRTYSRPQPFSRSSGAGDTFLAGITLGLAAGLDVPEASELASVASGIVVGKERTSTCTAAELRAGLMAEEKILHDRRVLGDVVARYRREGRRVVFTNGCFDILHRGHIAYLNRAKQLGDVLVVGLNTDEGVRRLKGVNRPLNPLEDRMEVLAALSCVDHLIPFAEETPIPLIESIHPDLYVKGGDYRRDDLPEVPVVEGLGGEVRILPFVADRSTTSLIERIQAIRPEPGSAVG